MLRVLGSTRQFCDGRTRREFIQAGGFLGAGGGEACQSLVFCPNFDREKLTT